MKKSFTLIELLVVIAIIGILSSLVIARFSDWNDNARIANTLQWSTGVHRTLGANLIGHWPLNGDLNDVSGYGNNGLLGDNSCFPGVETCPSWVDGITGDNDQALEFDGVDDYVRITAPKFNPSDNFSLSFWTKAETVEDDMNLLIKMPGGGNSAAIGVYLYNGIDDNYRIYFMVRSSSGAWQSVNHNNYMRDYGEKWTHFIGVWEDGYLKLYLNGTFITQTGEYLNTYESIDYIYLSSASTYPYKGQIDDVYLYNTALTTKEISRIYTESKDKYLVYE